MIVEMGRCTVVGGKDGTGADVRDEKYPIPMPPALAGKDWQDRSSALTWIELHERIAKAEAELQEAIGRQEELMLRRRESMRHPRIGSITTIRSRGASSKLATSGVCGTR